MRDETSCRQGNVHFSYCCWKYWILIMSDFFNTDVFKRLNCLSILVTSLFPLFNLLLSHFDFFGHSSSQFSTPIQCLSECPASASPSHGTVPLPPNVISLFADRNFPQSEGGSLVPGKTMGQHLPILGHMGLQPVLAIQKQLLVAVGMETIVWSNRY